MLRIENPVTRVRVAALAAGLLLLGTAAWATALAYDFLVFGNFRRMAHTGDATGQVRLAQLPQDVGSWGVGALAGLKGEVLLYDGRLLVSRGDDAQGRVSAVRPGDEAALFGAARVRRWVEVMVPSDLPQPAFEAFLLEQAKSRGIDANTAFAFLVQGRYPRLAWHVVTGQTSGPATGHGGAAGSTGSHAGKRLFGSSDAAGQLVGLYSGARFEGVITHPGERFHVHFADAELGVSGHVDGYAVAKGSVLKLPLQ